MQLCGRTPGSQTPGVPTTPKALNVRMDGARKMSKENGKPPHRRPHRHMQPPRSQQHSLRCAYTVSVAQQEGPLTPAMN